MLYAQIGAVPIGYPVEAAGALPGKEERRGLKKEVLTEEVEAGQMLRFYIFKAAACDRAAAAFSAACRRRGWGPQPAQSLFMSAL